MIILTIRTDKPEAELGIYDDQKKLAYEKWQAHRQLAETIHKKIEEILNKTSKSYKDIVGVACYAGPGSFTGLRIGMSVGNAIAYSLDIPIVARGTDNWIEKAITDLLAGKNDKIATPSYGAPAKTTKQRK